MYLNRIEGIKFKLKKKFLIRFKNWDSKKWLEKEFCYKKRKKLYLAPNITPYI